MYTLTKINTIKDVIDLLECFNQSNRYYWIIRLNVCDAIKGFLIDYFNV